MSAARHLRDARRALIEGRPDDALAALHSFHDAPGEIGASEAEAIRTLLRELAELAEAGQQGIVAARNRLTGAVELACGVATYDSQGRRAHSAADRRRPMRF